MEKIFKDMLAVLDSYSLDSIKLAQANPGEVYSKSVLQKNSTEEIIAVNWNSSQICLPHDHGTSIGVLKIITGSAVHIVYKLEKNSLSVVKIEIKQKGDYLISTKNMIHAMGNPTCQQLVTLHMYKKPIDKMKVYEIENKRVATVASNCGAWWPKSDNQLLEVNYL